MYMPTVNGACFPQDMMWVWHLVNMGICIRIFSNMTCALNFGTHFAQLLVHTCTNLLCFSLLQIITDSRLTASVKVIQVRRWSLMLSAFIHYVRASLGGHLVASPEDLLYQSLQWGHSATSLLWDPASWHAVLNVTPKAVQTMVSPSPKQLM